MHPAVISLVDDWQRRTGERLSPRDVMRCRARETISFGRQLGLTGPPYDPAVLASCLGIQVEPVDLPPDQDAMLIPRPGSGLLLHYNRSKPRSRINFTLCHEIAHTFFPDAYEQVRHRKDTPETDPVERLCDLGAAELLLPEDDFHRLSTLLGKGLGNVQALARRFEASREPVVRRLAALSPHPTAAVFLRPGYRKEELDSIAQSRPRLRIHHYETSKTFQLFLPINKSAPDDSCVYHAFRDPVRGSVHTSTEETWGLPRPTRLRVEALALPGEDASGNPTVAALIETVESTPAT